MPDPDGFIRPKDGRPPFLRLVPLEELLAETLGVGRRSKAVQKVHQKLVDELGNELLVLSKAGLADLEPIVGEIVAEAIMRARTGQVSVEPGFDGQYGAVRVGLGGQARPL
jgi:PHP family Zn ribbon phosphoesterase